MKYRNAVSAIIINNKGEYLFVQPVSYSVNEWQFVGGGIEPGESANEAIYREIEEEIGITNKHLTYLGRSRQKMVYDFSQDKQKKVGFRGQKRMVFVFKLTEDIKIACNHGEIRNSIWVSKELTINYLIFPEQHKIFTQVITEFGL